MIEMGKNDARLVIDKRWQWRLASGFRFGVGPMVGKHDSGEHGNHWTDWRRYVYALRIKGDGWTAWQVRLLWFYFGRQRDDSAAVMLLELQHALNAGGYDISECMACGRKVVCIPDGLPCCRICAAQQAAEQ
jgi:hypothetical protein